MNARTLDIVWALLIAATLATWRIGDTGGSGQAVAAAILAIAGVKGWLVIRDFMALRTAGFMWRAIVVGWLFVVLALVMLAYWMALSK